MLSVLIADDEFIEREGISFLLGQSPYEFRIYMAENGEEGVRIARKEIPDLVITDVMMPIMNGFECCRILKEDLKTCHIPIILLTALTDDENIVS